MLCGWISPNGEYISCDCKGHLNLAHDIMEKYKYEWPVNMPIDDYLVSRYGWIKAYYSIFDNAYTRLWCPRHITEYQKQILRDDYFDHPENWDQCEQFTLEELDVI